MARARPRVPADFVAFGFCVALIAVVWIDRFADAAGRGFLTGDLFVYYYPTYAHYGALLRERISLLWDPYVLCGVPGLASLQRGYAYPPHLIFAVLPTPLAMASLALGHFALAAGGTYWFARRIGVGTLGAAAAALLFAAGHHYPALTFFPNLLAAASWFPLGCALCVSIAEGRGSAAVAGLGVVWGMSLLAGYPQASLYTAYGWLAILAALLAWRLRPPRDWLSGFAHLAVAGFVGSLLAAVQLVPVFELIGEGMRSGGSLPVARMFPFGVPSDWTDALSEQLVHGGGTHLTWGFGLVALGLIPFAFAARGRRRLAAGLLVLGLAFGLWALGPATPAFGLLQYLPGLSSFRLPNRGLFITSFSFAIVAAIALQNGFDRWVRSSPNRGTAWGALLVWFVAIAEPLMAAPSGLGLPYLHDDVDVYDRAASLERVVADRSSRILIPDAFPEPLLPSKALTLQHLHGFGGYAPLNTRRQTHYFDYLNRGQIERSEDEAPFHGFVADSDGWLDRRRLLDLAAVRYVVMDAADAERKKSALLAAGLELGSSVALGERVATVWQNPNALPRVYVSRRALPAPAPAEMLRRLSAPSFDPLSFAYVEGAANTHRSEPATADHGAPAPSLARITRDEPTVVEVEADLGSPGILVLADAFYPGWVVTVDGTPGRVLPVNLLFRGVELPAGRHRVVFEYRPVSVWIGGCLSLAGASAIAALTWWGRRARP